MSIERTDVEAQLRRAKPSRIEVVDVDGDDERRAVALRSGRTRWEHAASLLMPMLARGMRAELLDDDGALLASIEAPREERGAEKRAPVADALLRQMLEAQDHAVDRVLKLVESTMSAQVRALEAITARVSAVEASHTKVLAQLYRVTVESAAAVRDATLAVAEAESAAAGSEMQGKLLDMAAPLVQHGIARAMKPKAVTDG